MGKRTGAGEPDNAALERLIFRLRERRAILDVDLARLYGVTTGRFNEAFRRNRERFPEDFAFQLSAQEGANLRSQIAISSLQLHGSPGEKQPGSRPSARLHGGRRYLPWAFTEHGALTAATVLNNPRAVAMSVYVVRAFAISADAARSHLEPVAFTP